jgi:RNA polymerase sigma-70 factor (ECF subfamily)
MASMTAPDGRARARGPGGATPSSTPQTFASIYAEHAQTIARWAARLGGPTADVEDITQEVFLVVNRRLTDWRGESRLSTWLFGITAKIAANERRRRKLRELWFRFVPNAAERARAPVEGALERLESRERRVLFHRVLDGLGERHRRVLVLFELEELAVDEIADLMDLRPGNVRVLLHRARAAFLKAMVACELAETERERLRR